MKYKLLLLDIDGTLRPGSCERVPKENAEAVCAVQKAGVKIAIATGRGRIGVGKGLLRSIRPDYWVCAGGAQLVDYKGADLALHRLTTEEMYALVDFFEDYDLPLRFTYHDANYAYLGYEEFARREREKNLALNIVDGEDQDKHLEEMPFGAFGFLSQEMADRFQEKYGYLGLNFLFSPDFSKVTAGVVLTAMGLAFFKLSIGMGCMMTYGSYFRDDQHIPLTTVRVMCADLFVSMLAGIAIFPAVFAFGFEPTAGPSLLFITIPAVFASIPFGHLFMVLFFVLSAIAATGAMLSILEVPVSVLSERFHMSRTRATLINLLVLGAVGSTCALSNSTLADVQIAGKTFFDLFDFVSSNVLMPLGGIFLCLFVGWVWGFERMKTALTNGGELELAILKPLFFIIRYVSPPLILIVMLKGLGLF